MRAAGPIRRRLRLCVTCELARCPTAAPPQRSGLAPASLGAAPAPARRSNYPILGEREALLSLRRLQRLHARRWHRRCCHERLQRRHLQLRGWHVRVRRRHLQPGGCQLRAQRWKWHQLAGFAATRQAEATLQLCRRKRLLSQQKSMSRCESRRLAQRAPAAPNQE